MRTNVAVRAILVLWLIIAFGPRVVASACLNALAVNCTGPLLAALSLDHLLAGKSATRIQTCCNDEINALGSEGAADAFRMWQARLQLACGNPASAAELLRAGAAAHPGDRWYSFMLGLAFHAQGDFDRAAATWAGVDTTSRVFDRIIKQLLDLDQKTLALTYARAAAAKRPSPLARLRLAETLFYAGHADEALEQYALAFAALPADAPIDLGDAAYHRAQLLAGRGRLAEAIGVLTPAFRSHPNYSFYAGYLGKLYSLKGDDADAEYCFRVAERIAPHTGYPYWEYGQHYVRRRMYRQALAKFRKAIEEEPDGSAYLYGDLGGAYLALGEFDAAISALQEALRRAPYINTYRHWLDVARSDRDRHLSVSHSM